MKGGLVYSTGGLMKNGLVYSTGGLMKDRQTNTLFTGREVNQLNTRVAESLDLDELLSTPKGNAFLVKCCQVCSLG